MNMSLPKIVNFVSFLLLGVVLGTVLQSIFVWQFWAILVLSLVIQTCGVLMEKGKK